MIVCVVKNANFFTRVNTASRISVVIKKISMIVKIIER